jgi:hypothetical protein
MHSISKCFDLVFVSESCRGNWNISVKSDSGSISLSWSPMESSQKNYTYAVVYYPSADNINSKVAKSTSIKIDYLQPDTEYIVRIFAFVPESKDSYFCTKRVRTADGK